MRVCACPGRDRTNEECSSPKSGNKTSKRGVYGSNCKNVKKRKLSSQPGEHEYTITVSVCLLEKPWQIHHIDKNIFRLIWKDVAMYLFKKWRYNEVSWLETLLSLKVINAS